MPLVTYRGRMRTAPALALIRSELRPRLYRALARTLTALARDRAGNALALMAAAVIPLLAILGGSIDMGRSYLAETRLQQACDAGVLATRKRLGTMAAVEGTIPGDAADIGNRFFDLNFRDGAYGTSDRDFEMTLDADYQVSGEASVAVPTTVMRLFGYDRLAVHATCQAQLNMANTDVMMVLDVTGSMNETNPGDSEPKIDLLKDTIRNFHAQLEAARKGDTRVRYGFVPYSTNVNVGGLLKDDWVVDEWTYQSRELSGSGTASGTYSYYTASSPVSGTVSTAVVSTYPATFSRGAYSCPTAPADTVTVGHQATGTTTSAFAGPPAGTLTRTTYRRTRGGIDYTATLSGTTCTVHAATYSAYVDTFDYVTQPALVRNSKWKYHPVTRDVSDWRTASNGCMEERDTYEIQDYDKVDLDRALDLDLDLVPDPNDPKTQWRPMYPGLIYARALKWDSTGSFTQGTVNTTDEYLAPAMANTAACPAPARNLAEMDADTLDSYLGTLRAGGSTYHDIGMIWGARLLSPSGLFAEENADVSAARPTGRHLIFLTDGQTSSLDISYSSYGLEPIDRRRWQSSSSMTLTQTVEARFAFACAEAKKRNISVWLVAFGTELNPVMTECAGPGHAFQASDGDELAVTFSAIANSIGGLRITG